MRLTPQETKLLSPHELSKSCHGHTLNLLFDSVTMRSFASVLCVVLLALVNSQDYAEYARGAGMARKKSSR